MSLPVSRRVLVIGGVAAAVALGGAGVALAAPSLSAAPASASASAKPGAAAKAHKAAAADLVTGVDSSSLTVDTPKGSKTFTLTSTTTYHRGSTKLTESDIKAGQLVRIRAAKGGTTAKAVAIAPSVVTGYVRSMSGGTLTVVDRSGFSHKVSTSGATYKKNGAAGQSSDVATGDVVHVQGFIDSDGSTIDATTVGVRHP